MPSRWGFHRTLPASGGRDGAVQPPRPARPLGPGLPLHDWNLDEKRTLIAKAYEALPDSGALVAYDSIIDGDRSQNAFGLPVSLNMLIETEGGFDYTAAARAGWMREADFRETRAEHPIGPDSMVVGIK